MARTATNKQKKIDKKFQLLCRDLNQIIIHTRQYNYGDFRFRVYQNCRGQYSVLLADISWHKEFGDKFQEVAHKHGYKLDFDARKGIYYIIELNNKNKKYEKERITLISPE